MRYVLYDKKYRQKLTNYQCLSSLVSKLKGRDFKILIFKCMAKNPKKNIVWSTKS